jgi:hypothetical protein
VSGRALPAAALALAVVTLAGASRADDPKDAGASTWSSCTERVPEGATRPQVVEAFPDRGFSGYASTLTVTVTHGKGETVLPEGFKVQRDSDAARALERSGFQIPEADGGAGPSLATKPGEERSVTTVEIPFLVLPEEPGRHRLVLPPVPIAVARASGDVMTLCTAPHVVLVEDPIANEADPKVKPNPEGRRQREDWVLARQLTLGALAGIAAGLFLGWLVLRWRRRPKVVVAPPPRPPWEVALEELEAIRRSKLLEDGATDAYFDRVSDCVRKYLGGRYGFDGLESTTDELLATLRRVRPKIQEIDRIRTFLSDCDLVKFARMVPSRDDCLNALYTGEQIVHRTMPMPQALAEEAAP